MKQKKVLFVYNAKAGKAQIKNKLVDIIDIFVKAGYIVTAYPTQAKGDAVRAVRERESGYSLVVCSGGDGTLDEVVAGMMESGKRLPIGYIPAGSTNDFANSLKLPKTMQKAAMAVVEGKPFACDIGVMNRDYFVYVAAFGIFTDVSYETDQQMKNLLGHMAYLLEGMKRLPSIRSYHMKVSCAELEVEDDFLFGMITNSVSVGGFKSITGKNVTLDDGVFEVTLIKRPRTAMEINQLMTALVAGNLDQAVMHCFRTANLTITSEQPVAWTRDGEYGGEQTEVHITNLKKAVKIMIPDK
ncbi:MAG: YegS/Rv2252/BmrU family lipid kinase [Lachnospiraceae bacterium]|nr:YegS/Rv2252/BmrU family lipid kinase [Lachnospiraceae bacterium]